MNGGARAAQGEHGGDDGEQRHRRARADHGVEGEVGLEDGRPVLAGEGVEALHLAVEVVGARGARARRGCAGRRGPRARPRRGGRRRGWARAARCGSAPRPRRAWPAASRRGPAPTGGPRAAGATAVTQATASERPSALRKSCRSGVAEEHGRVDAGEREGRGLVAGEQRVQRLVRPGRAEHRPDRDRCRRGWPPGHGEAGGQVHAGVDQGDEERAAAGRRAPPSPRRRGGGAAGCGRARRGRCRGRWPR